MQEAPDINNKTTSEASSLSKQFLLNLLMPLALLIIGLLIEYKSGYFQQATESGYSYRNGYLLTLFISVTLILFILFAMSSLLVWFRQYKYIREQFALFTFCSLSILTILILLSGVSGLMPWFIHYPILNVLRKEPIVFPAIQLTDYLLLLASYVLVFLVFSHKHQKWSGLKSIEQYRLEQRGENTNLFSEGFHYLKHLIKRNAPLKIHSEANYRNFITQLEPVTDSLVWKDQAKELIRLSSSSYAFDSDSGWHDKENCWVGQNVNTKDLIFLYPNQGEISKSELNKFLEYAKKITKAENNKIGEVIVATIEEIYKPVETWENLTIRYETKASLLNSLVDFKDYFNEIKRRVLVNHLPDSEITLNDVYVPSHFLLPDGVKCNYSIENYFNNWLDETGQRQLALLGEYGQGKSTATLMWVYHLINNQTTPNQRIPLLIELRGTSPRNLTPLQLLGAWASQYNINPLALMQLHIAGRLVLIFEGFDEMALVGDVEMRLKHFRTLWQFAYSKAKIIITGRPNFFLDEEEMKAALGISKPIGGRPYCEALRLEVFDIDHISKALMGYKSTIRRQIISLIKKNPRFLELVSRPSLLHIVAVLWERERLYEQIDQLTSAYIMDLFIRHSYRRQGAKEIDSPEVMALNTLEREFFMTGIATYMAAKRLPNQITSVQLNELITQLIESIPDLVSTESPAILGEITQPLRSRIKNKEYGVEQVKTDVRACGLLIDDPAAPGTFRFGHKSFMEYLFAATIAEYIQKKSDKAQAILNATNAQIDDILSLPVALDFVSELIVGIKNDNEVKQKTKATATAKRLYGMLVVNPSLSILKRLSVFIDILLFSIYEKSSSSIIKMLVRFIPFIIIFFAGMLLYNSLLGTSGEAIWIGLREKSILFLFLMSILYFFMFTYMVSILIRPRLFTWLYICEKIGIENNTLHEAIGTNLIPWVREKPLYKLVPLHFAEKIEEKANSRK